MAISIFVDFPTCLFNFTVLISSPRKLLYNLYWYMFEKILSIDIFNTVNNKF